MSISDDLLKHQIFLQRLVGTEYKEIKKQLQVLGAEAKLRALSGGSKASISQELISKAPDFAGRAIDSMLGLSEYEAQFSAKLFSRRLKRQLDLPTVAQLRRQLETNNMEINNLRRGGTRKSLHMAYKQFGKTKAEQLAQLIADSQVQGLSVDETMALIDEKINGLYSMQARSLGKTAVNYASNVGRSAVLLANSGVFSKVVWVSVLDNGTTEYCEEHDGTVYAVDEGPRPPAHWGCRSHIEPYFDDDN